MDTEEAIKILDPETTAEALAEIEYYNGFSGRTAWVQAVTDACVLAVAALREQEERENPKPLTLDELRQMDGQPVYIVDLCQHGGFTTGWTVFSSHDICGFQIKSSNKMLSAYGYGERWLAYRSKPKEDAACRT